MKNLSLRNNGNNYISDFFSDPFDSFFRPFFKEERVYPMKTDITETDKAYTLEIDPRIRQKGHQAGLRKRIHHRQRQPLRKRRGEKVLYPPRKKRKLQPQLLYRRG